MTDTPMNDRPRRVRRLRERPCEEIADLQSAAIPLALISRMAELELEPAEFILLIFLLAADDVGNGGGTVSVSLKIVGQATGLAYATVHYAKKTLVARGFLAVLNIRNLTRTNTYDLSPLRRKLQDLGEAGPPPQ
jgi:hypothetical protein